jgi:hypothetical protein
MQDHMKKVVLNVESTKYDFFLELIQSLDFVYLQSAIESENSREEVLETSYKAEVLQGLREAVEEVNQIKAGKKKAQPLSEFLNEL